jgi:CheY-like chemotaxis protein
MTQPRILLVDDEKHTRLFISRILTSMNCKVIAEGGNGEEAMQGYTSSSGGRSCNA